MKDMHWRKRKRITNSRRKIHMLTKSVSIGAITRKQHRLVIIKIIDVVSACLSYHQHPTVTLSQIKECTVAVPTSASMYVRCPTSRPSCFANHRKILRRNRTGGTVCVWNTSTVFCTAQTARSRYAERYVLFFYVFVEIVPCHYKWCERHMWAARSSSRVAQGQQDIYEYEGDVWVRAVLLLHFINPVPFAIFTKKII